MARAYIHWTLFVIIMILLCFVQDFTLSNIHKAVIFIRLLLSSNEGMDIAQMNIT